MSSVYDFGPVWETFSYFTGNTGRVKYLITGAKHYYFEAQTAARQSTFSQQGKYEQFKLFYTLV
jgi:hypothetical protein